MNKVDHWEVVWSGRDSLLPDRAERIDNRFSSMPSYDIDDGDVIEVKPKRKYTYSGQYKGCYSKKLGHNSSKPLSAEQQGGIHRG